MTWMRWEGPPESSSPRAWDCFQGTLACVEPAIPSGLPAIMPWSYIYNDDDAGVLSFHQNEDDFIGRAVISIKDIQE